MLTGLRKKKGKLEEEDRVFEKRKELKSDKEVVLQPRVGRPSP